MEVGGRLARITISLSELTSLSLTSYWLLSRTLASHTMSFSMVRHPFERYFWRVLIMKIYRLSTSQDSCQLSRTRQWRIPRGRDILSDRTCWTLRARSASAALSATSWPRGRRPVPHQPNVTWTITGFLTSPRNTDIYWSYQRPHCLSLWIDFFFKS